MLKRKNKTSTRYIMNNETSLPPSLTNSEQLDFDYEYNAALISHQDVTHFLSSFYGLTTKCIERLVGYDSANFYVEDTDNRPMIFKVIACTKPPEIAHFLHHQIDMMKTIAKNSPKELIQQVIEPLVRGKLEGLSELKSCEKYPGAEDYYTSVIQVPVHCRKYTESKHNHNAVLLHYIPGVLMIKALPFSLRLLEDVGLKFGMLSKAFEKVKNRFVWNRTYHKWDPKNVLASETLLDKLTGLKENRINICRKFFSEFRKLLPYIEKNCRRGIIHTDGNCNNILVNFENHDEVSAILDFEDTSSSYIVFECGSLIMYAFCYMLNSNLDMESIGTSTMKGFCVHQPLLDCEWNVLYYTVLARLVQSSIYGFHGALLSPENAEYVLETQEEGWTVLERLVDIDSEYITSKWRNF